MTYGQLKKYEMLLDAYRELYRGNVFNYVDGVKVTDELISLSRELEIHYEAKKRNANNYYSPLMEAIRIFFKSQRVILEVSNQLFKMGINDSIFSFEENSLDHIQFGKTVLDISSNSETQKIKEIFSEALKHVNTVLPELEAALSKVSKAKDQDLVSVIGGGLNILRAKIAFFNSIIAFLEKKFEEAAHRLEESIQYMERAIEYTKMNLDTKGEVENAEKTEAYLRLLINNYKNTINTLRKHTPNK
ncbi:MAG: hypothetical protein QXO71_09810 [Candidatus Jordarchaeaceae archaeon]